MQNPKALCCIASALLGLIVLPHLSSAQTSGSTTPALSPVETRWQELAVARKPAPEPGRYTGQNAAERAAARTAEIAAYVAKADQLKAFYTEFPKAAQVPEAKRCEALNLLLAAQVGDTTHTGRWQALVAEVRSDPSLPAADRFAVAAQADYLAVSRSRDLSAAAKLDAYAGVARGHMAEFPTEPGGYEALLALAKNQPAAKGSILAAEVAASDAPAEIKAQAGILAGRFALVGRKIDQILGEAKLPDAYKEGTPLVIYSWASWSEASQQLADKLKASTGAVTFVGLCLDTDHGAANKAAETRGLPGLHTYDNLGTAGALARALKLDDTGWVYVIDRTGTLVTVRGQDDLSQIAKL